MTTDCWPVHEETPTPKLRIVTRRGVPVLEQVWEVRDYHERWREWRPVPVVDEATLGADGLPERWAGQD